MALSKIRIQNKKKEPLKTTVEIENVGIFFQCELTLQTMKHYKIQVTNKAVHSEKTEMQGYKGILLYRRKCPIHGHIYEMSRPRPF